MRPGARSPEELETLYEDAFVLRNPDALAQLFADGALLATGDRRLAARGGEEIAQLATALWGASSTYVADPRWVLQARDTALVVADRGINVVHRGRDGTWRYVISLLSLDQPISKEES
jgi:hypothetical protein